MKTLTVDGCSLCQLKCPQCPASQMGYQNTIGKGYLHIMGFLQLLDKYPDTKHIEFDNFGELFLNPDLLSIMLQAQKERIMLSCSGGVNLNDVSEHILEMLVKTRFQYLNISIDGASQETYEQYRVGGDYATVINNISIINDWKQKLETPYPKLQWQFIVFGHNEHEIREAQNTATKLGMRFAPKMNWNSEYSPIKNKELVKLWTGWDVFSREEYEKKYGVSYVRGTCYQLWASPRYSWDLSCTGCCWNVWDRFDKDTLRYAKEVLTGRYPCNQPIPCNRCEIMHDIIKTTQFLSKIEVLKHTFKQRVITDAKYMLWRQNL